MIEIRQLRYFERIAELEHFGRAADELHIVQPALTRQMKQLEAELGVDLFERLPRGVRLTAAGKVFLEKTRQVLDELDRSVSAARSAAAGKTGFLRVGFADGVTYSGQFASIIGSFRQAAPDVELELIPAGSYQQASLLQENSIDVGFVYWLPKDQINVGSQLLNQEKIVLAMADTNDLAGRSSVFLNELHERPFVWIKRAHSPGYFDLINARCNAAGLTLNVVQEAYAESNMLSLVSADIGMTFITEFARRRKPDNVVLVEVADLNASLSLSAIWRVDEANPALKQFICAMNSALAKNR